jgi:hypothetical protein
VIGERSAALLEFAQLTEKADERVEHLSGVMDHDVIVAVASPGELIAAHSTREVLELRLSGPEQGRPGPR